jgi:hypothetical protein
MNELAILNDWMERDELPTRDIRELSRSFFESVFDTKSGLFRPGHLDTIAARSYRHTNGFFKIFALVDRSTGRAIRIHVWPPRTFDTTNVHDHKARFVSRVIGGTLEEERFELVDGHEWIRYSYDRDLSRSGKPDRLTAEHPTGAVMTATLFHSRDQVYEMPTDVLHRTRAGAGGAVSFVVTAAPGKIRSSSTVIAPLGRLPFDLEPQPLQTNQLLDVLDDARRLVCVGDG